MIRRGRMKKLLFLIAVLMMSGTISIGGGVVKIKSVDFNKSFYKPGEPVIVTVAIDGNDLNGFTLKADVMSLEATVDEKTFDASANTEMLFELPAVSKGYGLDVYLVDPSGKTVSQTHRGFDVMSSWTQRPKYGFLTDFSKNRVSPKMTMQLLAQYHINGLQYYDWMYDYGQLVYPGPGTNYTDAWSRTNPISETMIEKLVKTGHEYNIASMAYVAVYAMTKKLYKEHPGWALYEFKLGKWVPVNFNDKLIIAAPDNKGWSSYLTDQCELAIKKLGFDGIHLDQYGYPEDDVSASRSGTDDYHLYKTSEGFVNFINELKNAISPKTVYFNCVNDWPAEEVQSKSEEDSVYIEPWESCNTYSQLFDMINSAKTYSGGKPVILASYIKHFFENSIFYADSLIFADGAQHLELGEYGLLLDGPYFPGDAFPMSDSFMQRLMNYYDYSVRYESLLYGEDLRVLRTEGEISGSSAISSLPEAGKIFAFAKENSKTGTSIVQFINYTNLNTEMWREWQRNPETIKNLEVTLTGSLAKKLAGCTLYFVSADDHLKMERLNVSRSGDVLKMILPSLEYWSSIVAIPHK